jgi:hypothetical protein
VLLLAETIIGAIASTFSELFVYMYSLVQDIQQLIKSQTNLVLTNYAI